MGKLEDLRVERVDGVDRPATGHRFVIVKSERTAAQLLAELEKSDELTDEQRELVESFKATLDTEDEPAEPAASEEGVEKDEDDDDDPAEPVEKDEPAAEETPTVTVTEESLRETIKSVLTELIESELTETDEAEVAKTAGSVKSRQPNEQQREAAPVAKAKGEGMFSNIIFGQGGR